MRTLACVLAAVTAALVAVAAAQQPRDEVRITLAGTATVSGMVVLDDEKRPPVRRATVTLLRQGIEDIRTTATDDAGRYAFANLPSGTYILAVAKGGHLAISHGAPKSGMPGQPILLREGQSLTLPPVAVPRGAVIAGRVVDRFGRPVPNLGVQANLFLTINGERRRRAITGGTGTAVTNQHGEYRMFGLQPGTYIVFATPPSGVPGVEMIDTTPEAVTQAQRPQGTPVPLPPPVMYVPTLYPGVSEAAAATPVELGTGQERTDIDFVLQFVSVATIRGVVTGPDGTVVRGAPVVRQATPSSPLLPAERAAVVTDAQGRFTMVNVAPGTYIVSAMTIPVPQRVLDSGVVAQPAPPAGSVPLFGQAKASIGAGGVLELAIRMEPASALTGSVMAKGAARAEGARVGLTPTAGPAVLRTTSGTVDADHRFSIEGVLPGSYRLTISGLPRGTAVLSATIGDVDVLDVPFEVQAGTALPTVVVTITDMPATLAGRLVDGAGAPVSSLYVMAFSTNAAHWHAGSRRIGAMRAGVDGSYLFDTLPPGEYFVCALTEFDATLQNEPAFLQELIPASVRITIAEGQTIRQDLRIGR